MLAHGQSDVEITDRARVPLPPFVTTRHQRSLKISCGRVGRLGRTGQRSGVRLRHAAALCGSSRRKSERGSGQGSRLRKAHYCTLPPLPASERSALFPPPRRPSKPLVLLRLGKPPPPERWKQRGNERKRKGKAGRSKTSSGLDWQGGLRRGRGASIIAWLTLSPARPSLSLPTRPHEILPSG